MILDGDDATLITLSGTQAVAKDQYGLEYPWRARTLINMMPKPLRKLLKNQINQVMGVVQGMMEGIAPGRVVGWMKGKAITVLTQVKVKIVTFIQMKLGGLQTSKSGGGGGGGGGERGSVRNNEKRASVKSVQLMQNEDDADLGSDSIQEDTGDFISA